MVSVYSLGLYAKFIRYRPKVPSACWLSGISSTSSLEHAGVAPEMGMPDGAQQPGFGDGVKGESDRRPEGPVR